METKTREQLLEIIKTLQEEKEALKKESESLQKEKSDWIGYYNKETNKVSKLKDIVVNMSQLL